MKKKSALILILIVCVAFLVSACYDAGKILPGETYEITKDGNITASILSGVSEVGKTYEFKEDGSLVMRNEDGSLYGMGTYIYKTDGNIVDIYMINSDEDIAMYASK